MPALIVKKGDAGYKDFPFSDRITIGKKWTNDLVITEKGASREHACVEKYGEDLFRLTDHSTNGTIINGKTIHDDSVEIHYNDGFRIENWDFSLIKSDGIMIPRSEMRSSEVDLESLPTIGKTLPVPEKIPGRSIREQFSLVVLLMEELIRDWDDTMLIDKILSFSLKITNGDRIFISMMENGSLVVKKYLGFKKKPVNYGKKIAGKVMEESRWVATPGSIRDEAGSIIDRKTPDQKKSIVCLPIMNFNDAGPGGNEKAIGCLYIENSHKTGAFKQADIDFLGLPAMYIGKFLSMDRTQSPKDIQGLRNSFRELGIIFESDQMADLCKEVKNTAQFDVDVLILGESGTGKQCIAEAIHKLSDRKEHPFRDRNISELSSEIVASELFGHKKGAFTGADSDRKGIFEEADNGTLFLDEIGEFSREMQIRLLKFLDNRKVIKVGSNEEIPVDVRIVSATNRDLEKEVENGNFRLDFLKRISTREIRIPPLRERVDDIPVLAKHFLGLFRAREKKCTAKNISADAMKALMNAEWPGNVRELKNAVESAALNASMRKGSHVITIEDLPGEIRERAQLSCENLLVRDEILSLDEMKKKHIKRVLEFCDGNKSKAASILKVKRGTINNHLKKG